MKLRRGRVRVLVGLWSVALTIVFFSILALSSGVRSAPTIDGSVTERWCVMAYDGSTALLSPVEAYDLHASCLVTVAK